MVHVHHFWRLLLPLVVMGYTNAIRLEDKNVWENFKSQFAKSYDPKEDDKRYHVFMENLEYIVNHNLEADMGLHTYWLGITPLADLTHEEYVATYLVENMIDDTEDFSEVDNETSTGTCEVMDEDSVDYRKEGMVTPVKNQHRCGCCYTFSTTGSLEGVWKKKTGMLVSLSEQNILDCSRKEKNHGCKGGNQEKSFRYILRSGGIDTEESYPYEGKVGTCRFNASNIGAKIVGYKRAWRSEKGLKDAVKTVGTIACGVNGLNKSFQHYKRGVYNDPLCNRKLNHAVTIVGYGVEEKIEYWIVKNEWSARWGEQGYIRIARNHGNVCGIASYCFYPLV